VDVTALGFSTAGEGAAWRWRRRFGTLAPLFLPVYSGWIQSRPGLRH
jgi:hypothetical protein